MKTPEQIHAEVGIPLTVQHAQKMYKDGYRAFTLSDIAKIIDDAKGDDIITQHATSPLHARIARLEEAIKEIEFYTAGRLPADSSDNVSIECIHIRRLLNTLSKPPIAAVEYFKSRAAKNVQQQSKRDVRLSNGPSSAENKYEIPKETSGDRSRPMDGRQQETNQRLCRAAWCA